MSNGALCLDTIFLDQTTLSRRLAMNPNQKRIRDRIRDRTPQAAPGMFKKFEATLPSYRIADLLSLKQCLKLQNQKK